MTDAPGGPRRLDTAAVEGRLAGLDEALGALERTPGATAESALAAVAMLTEVYGEALARAVERVCGDERLVRAFTGDELLGHLLVLHGIHPEPVERRIERALETVRRQGADAGFAGLDGGTVRLRLAGGGCGAEQRREAVRAAVLAVAPEAEEVVFAEPAAEPAFVPVDSLLRRPVGAGDGTP